MLPERVMEIIAIDIGLVVITSWFLILLFMFREFRTVSQSVNRLSSNLGVDEYLPIYQKSVDEALASVDQHTSTLNELTSVHEILENQLSLLHQNKTSPQDDEKISQLQAQLDKSRALIKKLKGELVSSKKRLQHTKTKLYAQYDHVETLKKKEQFLIDAQQQKLDAEHNEALTAQAEKYKAQQRQLIEAASDYKKKLSVQGKELESFKQKNKKLLSNSTDAKSDTLNKKVVKLEKELKDVNEQSTHIIKEKDFIESKFLDSLKQLDEIKKSNIK